MIFRKIADDERDLQLSLGGETVNDLAHSIYRKVNSKSPLKGRRFSVTMVAVMV